MRARLTILAVTVAGIGLTLGAAGRAQTAQPPADLVLTNGAVLTVDPRDSVAEAVAITTGIYEDAKVDMPLPPGIQDDLSVQIALMVELLRGHTPDKFSLLSGNSVREYRYSRDGEETLTTPVGTIQTIIYRSEKQYSPRVTRFWCAPSLGYIPLRVEQKRKDDIEWTMQVQSVKREP